MRFRFPGTSVFILCLVACAPGPESKTETEGRGGRSAPFQPWEKQGVVLAPGFAGTRSSNLLSAPCVIKLENGRLRMYFWTREGVGDARSPEGKRLMNYIYAAEAAAQDPRDWTLVGRQPMLGPSTSGDLRDRGSSFPWVLPREDGPWLMYYVVWGSWAAPNELSNRTSLAVSHDEGITWEIKKEPLLPLGKPGDYDAGLTGSVCVLRTAPAEYRMWYTAGERYVRFGEVNRGIVHIGYGTSEDGIDWAKSEQAALSPRLDTVQPFEAVVSKPSVILLGKTYHMWFSVYSMAVEADAGGRGGYRLAYARSQDGLTWERFDDAEILPLSPEGFDSRNQSYPNLVEMEDELWMFYVGNDFGSTGIGLATLKKSNLR